MTIPVTILGGFLGAGKTTALNHLLRRATARIGVLVNDFGAVNIDAALIEAADGGLVALSNGCVCCAIGPDLGEALSNLLQRNPAPERIVIEASGVSDPWRIAQLVKLQSGVVLDAVIVLVDAASFTAHLRDRWLADTLERQLARADLIVLTKCDVADPADARGAVLRLRPDARIAAAAGGAIPDAVLGLADASPGKRLMADEPGHGFRTWHWAADQLLDPARLREVLAALPATVLRAKGFCRLGVDGVPHVLQLVGKRWTLDAYPGCDPGLGVVVIGLADMPAEEDFYSRFARAGLAP